MYIEPKIHILRNILIAASALLLIGVIIFFLVHTPAPSVSQQAPTQVGISGVLVASDANPPVYSINDATILNAPDLSTYVGKSVFFSGVMGPTPHTLIYETILLAEPPQPVTAHMPIFFTSHSDYSFVLQTNEGQSPFLVDVSTPERGDVQVHDDASHTIMEFIRGKDLSSLKPAISAQVAIASQERISVGGFPFDLQRIIPLQGNGLTERAVAASTCSKKQQCPAFTAILYNATLPENEQLFRTLLSNLVFEPNPQGWKLFKKHVDGAQWDFFLYYPSEVAVAGDDQKGYVFTGSDQKEIAHLTIGVFVPPSSSSKEVYVLPTRKETLYHLADHDEMILKMPEGNGMIDLTGLGPIFEAMIRSFTFVQ